MWGLEHLSDKIVFTFAFETWASLQLRSEDDKNESNSHIASDYSSNGTNQNSVSSILVTYLVIILNRTTKISITSYWKTFLITKKMTKLLMQLLEHFLSQL